MTVATKAITLLDALVALVGDDAADPEAMAPARVQAVADALGVARDAIKAARKDAALRRREERANYVVLCVVASRDREAWKAEHGDRAWAPKSFYGLKKSAANRAANIGDELRAMPGELFTTVNDDFLRLSQKKMEEEARRLNGKEPRVPHANQATRSRKAISTRIKGIVDHLVNCPDEVGGVVVEFLDTPEDRAAVIVAVREWLAGRDSAIADDMSEEPKPPPTSVPTVPTTPKPTRRRGTLYLISRDFGPKDGDTLDDYIEGDAGRPLCVVRTKTREAAIQGFRRSVPTWSGEVEATPMTTWLRETNKNRRRAKHELMKISISDYESVPQDARPFPTLDEYATRSDIESDEIPNDDGDDDPDCGGEGVSVQQETQADEESEEQECAITKDGSTAGLDELLREALLATTEEEMAPVEAHALVSDVAAKAGIPVDDDLKVTRQVLRQQGLEYRVSAYRDQRDAVWLVGAWRAKQATKDDPIAAAVLTAKAEDRPVYKSVSAMVERKPRAAPVLLHFDGRGECQGSCRLS